MVRVRILQGVSGADFSWAPGEVVEMSAEDAGKWADGYRAELVREEDPETPETSTGLQTPEGSEAPEAPEAVRPPLENTAARSRASRSRTGGK